MMRLPQYRHSIVNKGDLRVVALVDLGLGVTITNAAEEVVADLLTRGIARHSDRVIYRDTEGVWDELRFDRGGFVGFQPLGATTLEAALERLVAR